MPAAAMMLSGSVSVGTAGFYRTLTIDHTKVGSSTHTDFPVLVSGTYTYLKTTGNGGKVEDANGYDVGFFSDSALTTRLKHETERYVASTGEVVYWVKVPSVSHTVDTVIYMAYGDTSITTDQSDAANVWDSFYSGVYHMRDGTTLSAADSTGFANTGSLINTPTAGTGQIDGCGVFSAASSQYIQLSDDNEFRMGATFSLSAWIKPASFSDYRMIITKGDGNTRNYDLDVEQTTGKLRFYFTSPSTSYHGFTATTGMSTGTWYHAAATYDGTTQRIFLNGAADGTNAYSGTPDNTAIVALIGALGGGPSNFTDGSLDEVRISKGIARSVNWFLAEYNSQNDPSTFYAVGSEVPA